MNLFLTNQSNDPKQQKRHNKHQIKASVPFLESFCSFVKHIVIRRHTVALVIIGVFFQRMQKYSLWHSHPCLNQDKGEVGQGQNNSLIYYCILFSPKWDSNLQCWEAGHSPTHTPLSCPSQDVVCRLWSSTSCASTPNTSCP